MTTTQTYQPTINTLYSQEQISTYWPILAGKDEMKCYGRKDFAVQIAPVGCQPTVVRSDILEEQNVPVFCQLDAFKLNPLIDVRNIDRIIPSIKGAYPEGISGIGYYPARAALRSYDNLLGSPVLNNVGYLVVVLKRNEVEKSMPDYISANFTAVMRYDMSNAWGVGRSEYYLPLLDEGEWQRDYAEYEFWRGKGFLRLESIEGDKVSVSVYRDANHKIATRTLAKGAISDNIYLPGFYCMASLQLKIDDISTPEISVILNVNDDKIEARKGTRFLDNKCYVSRIESYGSGAGRVDIICGSEKKSLSLEMADVQLQVEGGNTEKFAVGQRVKQINLNEARQNIYLGYAGALPKRISPTSEQFIVLVTTKDDEKVYPKETIRSRIDLRLKEFEKRSETDLGKFVSEIEKSDISGYTHKVLISSDANRKDDNGIEFVGASYSDKEYSLLNIDKEAGKKIDEYFSRTASSYTDVSEKFPSETIPETGNKEIYGERALVQAAELAEKLGKMKTARELWGGLIERYPDSGAGIKAQIRLKNLAFLKTDYASQTFSTLSAYINLESIKTVTSDDASVDVIYSQAGSKAERKNFLIGEHIFRQDASGSAKKNYVSVKSLKEDSIMIDYECTEKVNGTDTLRKSSSEIKLKDSFVFCGNDIYVDKINLKNVAKVSIIPNILASESEVNFTFKIGIEKRAIKLSTEKTKEMISNLNDTIDRWESINKKLGNVVKGLKGACFATSAILQMKTLLEGFGGKTMARSAVMRGEGGWMTICEQAVATGKLKIGTTEETVSYSSVDDCLYKNSKNIDKSVSYMESKISAENKKIQGIESGITKTGELGLDKTVDTAKSREAYFNNYVVNSQINENLVVDGKTQKTQEIFNDLKTNKELFNSLSYDDMKEIKTNSEIYQDSNAPAEVREMAKKKLFNVMNKVEENKKQIGDLSGISSNLGVESQKVVFHKSDNAKAEQYTGLEWRDVKGKISGVSGIDDRQPVSVVENAQGIYLYVLNKGGESGRYTTMAKTANGGKTTQSQIYQLAQSGSGYDAVLYSPDSNEKIKSDISNIYFQKLDSNSYKNPFKIRPSVKYWETEPYKGMPAFVPVDLQEGWYAATKQTLPSFGNIKSYESSGRVTSFWLCNVGSNGIPQFDSGIGDDICEQINLQTGQPLNLFPGLTREKAGALINKAQKLIMEAADKYSSGVKKITIGGETFDIGAPAAGKLGTQCQDFMSPEDCYLLFNVCDPVICPTSRCNLGGNYYVEDVVQSGIIGSIALCLPNIKEGIFIPVCLTGIHAGIEGYLSILKAHRDCLSESLKSGKHIGICDEIYSIYLCEFFWRQLAPVLNLIIPKMIEAAYGQGARGGGEYLTVMNAWNNMENSMQYFTSYYAANAVKSFQLKNTEEVGTTICKAFVSAKYPNNLKLMLEPESPTQFSAWFSETAFSDATVPATSQYKVFYHIYAGKDSGVYYSVYLRNPPGTSFYESIGTISAATGYITQGEYADETKDFTAPKGYQELCVRINDQEKCGFKQVSTDFAINYIKDKYIAEQASASVTSEKNCISGTPSAYTLINPNIQAGAEESAMPSVYNRGITRICATADPGKTTEPGRWKDVGYCDDTKIRCWLDSKDVSDNIKAKDIRNATLASVDSMDLTNKIDKGISDTADGSASKLNMLRSGKNNDATGLDEIAKLYSQQSVLSVYNLDSDVSRLVAAIDDAYNRAIFSKDKVKFLMLKAEVYHNATLLVYNNYGSKVNAAPPSSTGGNMVGVSDEPNNAGSVVIALDGKMWKKVNDGSGITDWYLVSNVNVKAEGESVLFSKVLSDAGGSVSLLGVYSSDLTSTPAAPSTSTPATTPTTTPPTPAETGFVLHSGNGDGEIWLNGVNTMFYLEKESEGKFSIKKNVNNGIDPKVGTIVYGRITIYFTGMAGNDGEIYNLNEYRLENGKFVNKQLPVNKAESEKTLRDYYEDFTDNRAETPFEDIYAMAFEWQDSGNSILLSDVDWTVDSSGRVQMKIKDGWTGRLKLRIFTKHVAGGSSPSGYFGFINSLRQVKKIDGRLNIIQDDSEWQAIEVILTGGDYLIINIDREYDFSRSYGSKDKNSFEMKTQGVTYWEYTKIDGITKVQLVSVEQ